MERVVATLKEQSRKAGFKLSDDHVYELLAVACSQCCTDANGGNKTCPPPR